MPYTSAISKSGQVTLPSALRKLLGVSAGDKINFIQKPNGEIILARAQNLTELTAKWDRNTSADTKALIQKHAGQTVSNLRADFAATAEGQAYYKEEYGN